MITQQQRQNTHVAARYIFMPWQKNVCETLHKLHIHKVKWHSLLQYKQSCNMSF